MSFHAVILDVCLFGSDIPSSRLTSGGRSSHPMFPGRTSASPHLLQIPRASLLPYCSYRIFFTSMRIVSSPFLTYLETSSDGISPTASR
jgi:hypothetical protein